jgi:hypothetical protein
VRLLNRLGSERVVVELVEIALECELVFGPDPSEAANELCHGALVGLMDCSDDKFSYYLRCDGSVQHVPATTTVPESVSNDLPASATVRNHGIT